MSRSSLVRSKGVALVVAASVLALLAPPCFADELSPAASGELVAEPQRPVRQVQGDDGVIELTNAKHAPARVEVEAPEPAAKRPLAAEPVTTTLAARPLPQPAPAFGFAWWWWWLAASSLVAGGVLLVWWRRQQKAPSWAVMDPASERLARVSETPLPDRASAVSALSTLTPRERLPSGEPQWISQVPRSRRADG